MKKVLASIGIGNATVDTVLPSETVRPGETVDAEVNVTGGDVEQEVGAIRFEIETRYRTDDGYREADVGRFSLGDGLTIAPDQRETRQVSIDVPYRTPVSMGKVEVWVETELDIDLAVDPEDKDYLDVRPTPRLRAVFDALEELGLRLHTAECEADPYGRYGAQFVQEFEFRAHDGPFRGDLDELELVASPGPDELALYVEVDRRGGLLSELAETDERHVKTTVRSTDVDAVRGDLREAIERRV